MNKTKLMLLALPLMFMAGCKSDDDEPQDYKEWLDRNKAYVADCQQARDNQGKPLYTTLNPSFAPGIYSLVRWHNDRTLTDNNLRPLDNSTVKVNYQLHDIEGNLLDKGAGSTFQPCGMVVGFWTTLTNMQVGDTVTAVVPYEAGYGNVIHGSIKPYTTLIFSIRLKEIVGYEIKH